MKTIELEVIFTFIGTVLGLISVVNHITGNLYPALLYVSLFCLFASKWLELADRLYFETPELNELEETINKSEAL